MMSKDRALGCCNIRRAGVATLAMLRVCDVDECRVVDDVFRWKSGERRVCGCLCVITEGQELL
jgi:hypothetical protein